MQEGSKHNWAIASSLEQQAVLGAGEHLAGAVLGVVSNGGKGLEGRKQSPNGLVTDVVLELGYISC